MDERKPGIRLFFALWPDQAVRSALRDARDAGLGSIGQVGPQPARAIHPDDLHVTLVFIGDVDPALLPCIEAAAADIAAAPFELQLGRIETWRRQRLLVAVPDAPSDALFGLVGQLEHNLLACGIAPESRRYRPHVTLARRAGAVEPLGLDVRWPVQGFVLARSGSGRRGSGGGGYEVLRRWPF
jgi:2'-5' RNA ligase